MRCLFVWMITALTGLGTAASLADDAVKPLKGEQLERFQKYAKSGRPIVAVRTASHAVQTGLEFDKEVLGGNSKSHHPVGSLTQINVKSNGKVHPVLEGVELTAVNDALYKNLGHAADIQVLLEGTIPGQPTEPLAWTREFKGGRIFYTSLGAQDTFQKLPNVEVGYVCDVDDSRLAVAAKNFGVPAGKAVNDLRRVLDDKSVDAVIVATPDHWHSLAAILACDAGKHVYAQGSQRTAASSTSTTKPSFPTRNKQCSSTPATANRATGGC